MSPVMVATVCSDSLKRDFVYSLLRLRDYDLLHEGRLAHGGWLCLPSANNIASARNSAVRAFLETDLEWLWFVDSDQTFEPDILERLLESADAEVRPIVSALVVAQRKRGEFTPAAVALDPGPPPVLRLPHAPPEGRYWLCVPGTGCVLIHRSVLEAVGEAHKDKAFPWFEFAPWQRTDDAGRSVMDVMGEDFTFMVRASSLGYPAFVDTTIEAGHIKGTELWPAQFWPRSA